MFTLVHFTDLHIAPLPALREDEWSLKRRLSHMSWTKNRHYIHRAEVIEALAADIKAIAPDHIAISGDLTNMALDSEFDKVRAFLVQLGGMDNISIVPGNHDAYRADYADAIARYWGDYTDGQGFPFMREFDDFILIGVSSAVKTLPFMADGRVDAAQLRSLENMLRQAAETGKQRIIMIHHPPHKGAVQWRKKLMNDAAFRDVIARAGAELILYGHAHKATRTEIASAKGKQALVRGAGSASASGFRNSQPAHYHVIRIASPKQCEIEHRVYDPQTGVFGHHDTEILSFF